MILILESGFIRGCLALCFQNCDPENCLLGNLTQIPNGTTTI